MLGEILKYLSVYLVSMIKFMIGPALGFSSRIEFWVTILLTISGMMTSVMIFCYLGEQARRKISKEVLLSEKRRQQKIPQVDEVMEKIWHFWDFLPDPYFVFTNRRYFDTYYPGK